MKSKNKTKIRLIYHTTFKHNIKYWPILYLIFFYFQYFDRQSLTFVCRSLRNFVKLQNSPNLHRRKVYYINLIICVFKSG